MTAIDRQLFEATVRRHHVAVFRSARRILRCDADAEDVTQRVFLRVLQNGDLAGSGVEAERTLRWLATRLALNELRGARRRARNERSAPMPPPSVPPSELAAERERVVFLEAAVAELPDELRLPLVLRYQEGLSYTEVGRAVGLPESTVHGHVRRGLERLRRVCARAGVVVSAVDLRRLCSMAGAVAVPAHLEDELLSLRAPVPAAAPSAAGKALATGALALAALGGALLEAPRALRPPKAVVPAARTATPSEPGSITRYGARRPASARGPIARPGRDRAQDPEQAERIRFALEVRPASSSSMLIPAHLRGKLSPEGRVIDGEDYEIDFSGVPTLRITGRADDRCVLRVDADDDGDFEEEESRVVPLEGKVEIAFEKRRGDGVKGPVRAWLWPLRGRTGDSFAVVVGYAAAGTLSVGGHEAAVELLDVDGNGYFERREFARGTTIRIDRDGDGAFSTPGEIASGDNLLELGGRVWRWADLARDGSWVQLEATSLPIPRLGRPLPELELETTAGERVETRGRQRPLLIALWASWCVPCTDKMPEVRRLAERADCDLLYYSVDARGATERAQKIAEERGFAASGLAAPGLGRSDPLWKMLNSMHGGSIGVPKFALLDRDGVLRYAGSDLGNLEVALHSPDHTTADALLEDPTVSDVTVELHRGAGLLRFLDAEVAIRLSEEGHVLQVDRDGDGRFTGPAENLPRDQPFALAGGQLQIAEIAEDRGRVRFCRSRWDIPRLGRTIMGYVFRRRSGAAVFLGKVERRTALVFWSASSPGCMAEVDRVVRGAGDADVHLICVDAAGDFESALDAAARRGWPAESLAPSTAGGADHLFEACAGMAATGRATPMFVVLDTGGVVRAGTRDSAEALEALR